MIQPVTGMHSPNYVDQASAVDIFHQIRGDAGPESAGDLLVGVMASPEFDGSCSSGHASDFRDFRTAQMTS